MRARLIDIAQVAGVSEATVSRVLNGRSGVNDATRRIVIEAARRLGRDVTPEREETGPLVGVLVPDLDNQVFGAWVERIEAELFQRGASALIALRARTVERERDILRRFQRARADGIIVLSGHHAQSEGPIAHYREVTDFGIPLVLINGVREDLTASYLSTDDDHAVRIVVAHLEELGHTRIGLAVGDESTWPVRTKVAAFEDTARRSSAGEADAGATEQDPAGTDPARVEELEDRLVSYTDFSYAGGYEAARDLVDRGATAIMCGSDVMAAGALEGVRSLGLEVPADVSVVGYDDVSWAALTSPPLTTVRQAVPQMARAAVVAALSGGSQSRRPARTEVVVRPQLVVRGSTAAAPR